MSIAKQLMDGIAQRRMKSIRRTGKLALLVHVLGLGLSLAFPFQAHAAVYAYFSSTAQTLQADFLKNATNQYEGTLTQSGGNYFFVVSGKKTQGPGIPVCDLDKQVALMVANSTKTYDYGFSNGMDIERFQNIQVLYNMQGKDFAKNTCAGNPIPVSTSAFQSTCLNAYNVIVSTIGQRWGYVFTSTGGFVQ